jgi:hypothetical protein
MDSIPFLEGFMAAQDGKPRLCVNPWNVWWLREWQRGYDENSPMPWCKRCECWHHPNAPHISAEYWHE